MPRGSMRVERIANRIGNMGEQRGRFPDMGDLLIGLVGLGVVLDVLFLMTMAKRLFDHSGMMAAGERSMREFSLFAAYAVIACLLAGALFLIG